MYKEMRFFIYLYFPQLKKKSLVWKFWKKIDTWNYFAVNNNQNQGENSGDLALIMLGKEPKKARLGGLETGWLGGAWEEEMQKNSSMFSGWHPQEKIKPFVFAREEHSLLLFAELSLQICAVQFALQLLLGAGPWNAFVLSPWHNNFGLFPSVVFSRILV